MQIYLMVAIIYFAMSFVAARAVRWIEQRFTPVHRGGRRTSSLSRTSSNVATRTATEATLES
jgi:polar amino acid transport system permease protein